MATPLTLLELHVLELAAHGYTVDETAAAIGRSRTTVKTHRAAVLDKLSARNVGHAVRLAYEQGVLGVRADAGDLPPTDGQRRAFFAKASDLDIAKHDARGTAAKRAIYEASERLQRPIDSVKDLTRSEISDVIDQLQHDLDANRTIRVIANTSEAVSA